MTAQDVIATKNRDSDDGVVCVPVWHLCYSRLRGGGNSVGSCLTTFTSTYQRLNEVVGLF